jgi:hypothetical protein
MQRPVLDQRNDLAIGFDRLPQHCFPLRPLRGGVGRGCAGSPPFKTRPLSWRTSVISSDKAQ